MPATTITLNNILNYNFGAQVYSPVNPANMYFGLSTTLVDATGLATSTEPATASGYTRQTYVNDTAKWTTSSVASLSNKIAITWTQASASWGTILSVFIADSTTRAAGNILWYHTLSPTMPVPLNTTVSFAIGAIIVTIT